jgi:hypothetical protein
MNERIKQLAEQAVQLVADEHTKGDVSRLNTDSYQVKDLVNEKFAELIVKECLDKVTEAVYARELSGRYYPGTDGRKIMKHFGVEE